MGRAKVDLAFVQTQPRPPHPRVAGELLRVKHNFHAFSYCRANKRFSLLLNLLIDVLFLMSAGIKAIP